MSAKSIVCLPLFCHYSIHTSCNITHWWETVVDESVNKKRFVIYKQVTFERIAN